MHIPYCRHFYTFSPLPYFRSRVREVFENFPCVMSRPNPDFTTATLAVLTTLSFKLGGIAVAEAHDSILQIFELIAATQVSTRENTMHLC
jgi:hypothetical protein